VDVIRHDEPYNQDLFRTKTATTYLIIQKLDELSDPVLEQIILKQWKRILGLLLSGGIVVGHRA